MKKLFLILMILCLALPAMGQDGTGVQTNQNAISVNITSGTAKSIWYGFPGSGTGLQGFSEVAIDPKNRVFNTGDLTLVGNMTVASGTEASDSLSGYAVPLGPDGYVIPDTMWFDWDSHTSRITQQTGADGYLDWTAFSGTLGVTAYTFSINLTNKYMPAWGLKIVLTNNNVLGDMVATSALQIGEVR